MSADAGECQRLVHASQHPPLYRPAPRPLSATGLRHALNGTPGDGSGIKRCEAHAGWRGPPTSSGSPDPEVKFFLSEACMQSAVERAASFGQVDENPATIREGHFAEDQGAGSQRVNVPAKGGV